MDSLAKCNPESQDPATEIRQLHNEIGEALKTNLAKALRIGELLVEQKTALPHGQWLPWIEANLPFTSRTAERYVKLYDARNRLKFDAVSNLGEAYRLLTDHQSQENNEPPSPSNPLGHEKYPPPAAGYGLWFEWQEHDGGGAQVIVIEPYTDPRYYHWTHLDFRELTSCIEGTKNPMLWCDVVVEHNLREYLRVKDRQVTLEDFEVVPSEPWDYNPWLYDCRGHWFDEVVLGMPAFGTQAHLAARRKHERHPAERRTCVRQPGEDCATCNFAGTCKVHAGQQHEHLAVLAGCQANGGPGR